jgi:hypothetical protein
MNPAARLLILFLGTLAVGACAARLGGGGPQEYEVLAFRAAANAAPADVAGRIGAANGDIVLLSADRDSAWFAAVAAATGMGLSGPGATGAIGMAFLARLEVVGDTSLVLEVPGGGSVHMHDALYRVNKDRFVDLMSVRFDAPDLRAAVRRLLDYIATDVGADVPVLLAVDGATPQMADSAAILMRAYYNSDTDCRESTIPAGTVLPLRLLYGPSALAACRSSRLLPGAAPGVAARVTVTR